MPHEDRSTDYELLETKGEGSFGEVYSARRIKDELIVAIKSIEVENNVISNSLEREIDILRECSHPNVVNYFTSFRHKSYMWIVMEYCEVGSIRDILDISEKTLSENQIAFIMSQILLALVYLHAKGIIHRDLKAGNVLLTGNGEVKVADFGVSGKLSNPNSKRLTVIGTPLWMSPEVIKGIPYSTYADIWSLGITAIEMADGYPPYSDEHPMKAMFKIPFNPPPTVENPSKFSDHFNDFVSKCLIKETNKRPSAVELLSHPFIISGLKQKEKVVKLIESFKVCLLYKKIIKKQRKHNDDDDDEYQFEDFNDDDDDEYDYNNTAIALNPAADLSTTILHDDDKNAFDYSTVIKRNNGDDDDENDGTGDFSTIIRHTSELPKNMKFKVNIATINNNNDQYSTMIKHGTIDFPIDGDEEKNDFSTIVRKNHSEDEIFTSNYQQYLTHEFESANDDDNNNHNHNIENAVNSVDSKSSNDDNKNYTKANDADDGVENKENTDLREKTFPIHIKKSKNINNSMRLAVKSFPKRFNSVNNMARVKTQNRGIQVEESPKEEKLIIACNCCNKKENTQSTLGFRQIAFFTLLCVMINVFMSRALSR